MKFSVITLGCKVNAFESESYIQTLINAGYIYVDSKEAADIYIVNSCAVTNMAANKTRQRINQAHRNNPNALIVVVGCYAQVETDKLLENEKIDLLVGSNRKGELLPLIEQVLKGKSIVAVDKDQRNFDYEDLGVSSFSNQHRAFLKVQDGCDQFCSYCIIPFARGKERSQELTKVIENAQYLVRTGHKEIVLSGIHTGRYGSNINSSLKELMETILNQVTALERLRISSIEILEVSDEIIDLAKSNHKIANHWHIPLQSGTDKTLKAMNRRYTTKEYQEKIKHIRKQLPNVSISADVIVGFPNESEADFQETYDFIKNLGFSFLHVFPYSPKTTTVAEKLANQVDGNVKKARVSKLLALSQTMKHDYIKTFINKPVSVLVEGKDKEGYYKGYTSEYFEVRFKSKADVKNKFINVIVNEVRKDIAYGTAK